MYMQETHQGMFSGAAPDGSKVGKKEKGSGMLAAEASADNSHGECSQAEMTL